VVAFLLQPPREGLQLTAPELRGRHALVLRHVEPEQLGITGELVVTGAPTAEVEVRLRVVGREGLRRDLVAVEQRVREPVRLRDAHCTRLGPEAGCERLSQREDAPTDA